MRYDTPESRRRAVARYHGLVSLVDAHHGRVLDELQRQGRFDDALIIYTSDHGEMLNQFGIWGKGVQYHGAIHVPLIIKLPGQRTPCRHAQPVSQVDLLPTILDARGLPIPAHLPGRSLLPACRGGDLPAQDAMTGWEASREAPANDPAISLETRLADAAAWHRGPVAPEHASVRSVLAPDGWRASFASDGHRELFDLNNDPGERRNLAEHAEHRGRLRDRFARLVAHQRRTGDFLALAAP